MATRRARIICTIGPASRDTQTLGALMDAGMNVARLNFSHGTHADHAETINRIRTVAGPRHVAVLQDLQGPKIRIGKLPEGHRALVAGTEVILTGNPALRSSTIIDVSFGTLHEDVSPGERILLDDGNLSLQVVAIEGELVRCTVIDGGLLKDHKGLNLPGSTLSVPPLSGKDLDDLEFGLAAGVDLVAMSFVQRPSDIDALRGAMERLGRQVPIIAKIEKPQALAEIDAILERADAVMVARGDLGVEVPPEEVPMIQKRLIATCNQRRVPVITATQMLESMIEHPRPTRAEASDVANAVIDGTDAVMLSGETAAGAYPVEAARTMERIVRNAEAHNPTARFERRMSQSSLPPAAAIGYAASQTARMIEARAIICLTQSGSTARLIATYRPDTAILALAHEASTCRQLAIVWGVEAHLIEEFADNSDLTIQHLLERLKTDGRLQAGDQVVFTTGLPFSARRTTNTLRIETVA